MRTINGKLITQEQNQLDTIKQQTQTMIQHYQHLESQVNTIIQQQNPKNLQEINTVKTHLQKLDRRLNSLEATASKQFTQFVIINIFSMIGLIGFWFWFEMSNQPTYQKNKAQTHAESIELYLTIHSTDFS
ncbi:MAG: hypothetical protein RMY30_029860 [Nostoc sp. CmiSLP01]|nr:hypothetical protein [Nostoc sp. CmiSLP01]MDZ8289057.1 hypothetical protein [Nostoc sp. ChiSLP01]